MTNNIFHITNRGVEKRKIFLDQEDYLRFVDNMRDFNDFNNAIESYARRVSDVRRPTKQIVNMLAWCLMPNHIHVLVSEKISGGASLFSKKIIGGYTKYFNLKYKRKGVLFQGRSKIISIERENHFIYMPYYIFANPIKLIDPHWKDVGIKDRKRVLKFLENYKWSSFADISGGYNFPTIINKKLFFDFFDTNEELTKKDFVNWLTLSDVRRPTNVRQSNDRYHHRHRFKYWRDRCRRF